VDFQVVLTKKAEADLADIGDYIARDNPEAARRFCGQLLSKAKSLADSPRSGPRVRRKAEVRRLVIKNYLIFYQVFAAEGRIEILRFWHAARDRGRLRLREEPAVA
jgi:toxin ParE1/3/4